MRTREKLEDIVVKRLFLMGYTKDRILTNKHVEGIGEFDILVILRKRSFLRKEEILAIECKHWSSGTFTLPEYLKFAKKCDLLAKEWGAIVYQAVVTTVPPSKGLKTHLNRLKRKFKYHGYWQVGSEGEYSWESSGLPSILQHYR